ELSWLLAKIQDNAQVIRLFDGADPVGAGMTVHLEGEDEGDVPVPPPDSKKQFFRWVPDVHRIFKTLGLHIPDCPPAGTPDYVPEYVCAKMRLTGGRLMAEDILRKAEDGTAKTFRFDHPTTAEVHRQPLATAAVYTIPLAHNLVLDVRSP